MDKRRCKKRGCAFNFKKSDLEKHIASGLTSFQIADILKVSAPTIRRYARIFGLGKQLEDNGIRRQHKSNYKDGRASYRKFKKAFCEDCGITNARLEIHHIKPVIYDSKWSTIIAGDHSESNLKTICNSCHQKTHYRKLGRKPMRSNGKRFFSNAKY